MRWASSTTRTTCAISSSARIGFLEQHDQPYEQYVASGMHFATTRVEVDYHRPARFADVVEITVWAEAVRFASLRMAYVLRVGGRGRSRPAPPSTRPSTRTARCAACPRSAARRCSRWWEEARRDEIPALPARARLAAGAGWSAFAWRLLGQLFSGYREVAGSPRAVLARRRAELGTVIMLALLAIAWNRRRLVAAAGARVPRT